MSEQTCYPGRCPCGCAELAELRARVKKLETSLLPFAKEYELLPPGYRDGDYYFTRTTQLRIGDLHRAAVLLKEPRRA